MSPPRDTNRVQELPYHNSSYMGYAREAKLWKQTIKAAIISKLHLSSNTVVIILSPHITGEQELLLLSVLRRKQI